MSRTQGRKVRYIQNIIFGHCQDEVIPTPSLPILGRDDFRNGDRMALWRHLIPDFGLIPLPRCIYLVKR